MFTLTHFSPTARIPLPDSFVRLSQQTSTLFPFSYGLEQSTQSSMTVVVEMAICSQGRSE